MKKILFLIIALNFVINLNAQTSMKDLSNTAFCISKQITCLKDVDGNLFEVKNDTKVELKVETFGSAGNLVTIKVVNNNKNYYYQIFENVNVVYFDTNRISSYGVFNSKFNYLKLIYDKENKFWYADIENELR